MHPSSDPLADLGLAACPLCGEPMEAEGDVREVDRGDGVLLVSGSAHWRCPRDGFVRLT